MDIKRRSLLVYGLLVAVWALVITWQIEEHVRFQEAAKADLSNRAKDIANTVSACIRGMRGFRGTVTQERLEPVLNELIYGRTNEVVKSSELLFIALLNAAGEPVAQAGRAPDSTHLERGERWGQRTVIFVNPVDLGASVLPPMTNNFPEGGRGGRPPFSRREPGGTNASDGVTATNLAGVPTNEVQGPPPGPPPRPDRDRRDFRSRRPFWLLGMDETEYQMLMEKRALHGLAVQMSTDAFNTAVADDLWVRSVIFALATISLLGSSLAWRNLAKTSDLQIRLVRASEQNTHLREMNLAAAGLAHETRNPLNIIRGLAQMLSKRDGATPEVKQKSREIVDEADKVAAQLNEFINYSRPREVRRVPLALGSVITEVTRTLGYDLEEKKIQVLFRGDSMHIEADEQMLRQALFNLILNAIQAVNGDGQIEVVAEKRSQTEGCLEVRDNGPGVAPEHRSEIFKPYFTTQKTGTGLGLAVVQQIVLAHGWEIQCLPNSPTGAVFRISHLRLANA
jgi:signal transduction histidine kinase